MFKLFKNQLSDLKIKSIVDDVNSISESGNDDLKWEFIQPLVKGLVEHKNAALGIIELVDKNHFNIDQAAELLSKVYQAYDQDDEVIIEIGKTLESARDIDDLNAPPPTDPLFNKIVRSLSSIALRENGTEVELKVHEGLSTAARLCARQHDKIADESYARITELHPKASWAHYGQGLFFKTRARFDEGVKANQAAISLTDNPTQAYFWNLGICATGAGQGEIALKVWKDQGQKIEMGRFDLPEGGYPSCKVKLAQFPLSERNTNNDHPGLEETIWIERLSPCHGIVRSVLFEDLGLDYGDVILFDGAPITYHKYGDDKIAVFPHLATLKKQNYQFYDFKGTQDKAGRLGSISSTLDDDAVIYSHTERFKVLCATCWRDEDTQHQHDQTEEKHVVSGRIAAPRDMNPKSLLDQIDLALNSEPQNRIFSPDLCRAAGLEDRAHIEDRRFNMLSAV